MKVGAGRQVMAIFGFAAAYLVVGLLIRNQYYQLMLTLVLVWAIMGVSWNVFSGYSGLVSFGHASFFGLGAYTVTLLLVKFDITPWLGIPLGMLVGVAAGVLIGYPTFRLRGHYFALAMLAYPLALLYIFEWLGYQEVALPMKRESAAFYMQFSDHRAYVLIALAYMKGLGLHAMARSDAVAADLLKAVWGTAGEKVISIMIAIAALTSVNGSIIVGARSNYALGKDWPIFGYLGKWDEASGSPRNAMLVQGAIAMTLVGLGAFQKAGFKGLVEYSLPVFWGFFMLVGIALFVLRAKEPNAPRPFHVPLYPLLPAIFVCMCGYLLYSSLTFHGGHALVGLAVLAMGGVVLLVARAREARQAA